MTEDNLSKIVTADGTVCYYRNGVLHNNTKYQTPEGLTLTSPAVSKADGTKQWFFKGEYHRFDKDSNGLQLPACINSDGTQFWYFYGALHRIDSDEDGYTLPAIICPNGYKEWWVFGGYMHNNESILTKVSRYLWGDDSEDKIKVE